MREIRSLSGLAPPYESSFADTETPLFFASRQTSLLLPSLSPRYPPRYTIPLATSIVFRPDSAANRYIVDHYFLRPFPLPVPILSA